MTRIEHAKQQPKCVYYWDYYILCQMNVGAALALQRLEYWDGTMSTETAYSEETPHWIYKSQDELRWELMGMVGEKGLASLLAFLEELHYLSSRRNPDVHFDRKKQYLIQRNMLQEHLDYLSFLLGFFQQQKCRLLPIYYTIEVLTREKVYIDTLSVSCIFSRLRELQSKKVLPAFLHRELLKDTEIFSSLNVSSVSRNFTEWKATTLRNESPQNNALHEAKERDAKSISALYIPQKSGSNSINYKQQLQTIITKQQSNTEIPKEKGQNQEQTHSLSSLLSAFSHLNEKDLRVLFEHMQKKLSGKTSIAEAKSRSIDILDAWDRLHQKKVPRTEKNRNAGEQLARIGASEEDIQRVRLRLLQNAFWQKQGVSLTNVLDHFHLASPSPSETSNATSWKETKHIRNQDIKERAASEQIDQETLMHMSPPERIAYLTLAPADRSLYLVEWEKAHK